MFEVMNRYMTSTSYIFIYSQISAFPTVSSNQFKPIYLISKEILIRYIFRSKASYRNLGFNQFIFINEFSLYRETKENICIFYCSCHYKVRYQNDSYWLHNIYGWNDNVKIILLSVIKQCDMWISCAPLKRYIPNLPFIPLRFTKIPNFIFSTKCTL